MTKAILQFSKERLAFSINGAGLPGYLYLPLCTKIKAIWNADRNVKGKTITFLEENVEHLSDLVVLCLWAFHSNVRARQCSWHLRVPPLPHSTKNTIITLICPFFTTVTEYVQFCVTIFWPLPINTFSPAIPLPPLIF